MQTSWNSGNLSTSTEVGDIKTWEKDYSVQSYGIRSYCVEHLPRKQESSFDHLPGSRHRTTDDRAPSPRKPLSR